MRTLRLALLAALVTALGCRANTGQVLVEQEARMLEDEVYHLEAQLDACCQAKADLKRENDDLRRQLNGAGSQAPSNGYRAPAVELPSTSPPAKTEPPAKLEPPTIELPEATDAPPDTTIPDVKTPGDEQPAVEGQPSSLSINRRMTGGMDRDGAGGDEGIMVVVEPRNSEGRLVKTPGAISLVLMDPSQHGDAARVARWDFQVHEFDDHFKSSTFGRGLQYELNWPTQPPQSHDLVLFVRYIAADGTKITAEAPLAVRLASDTPREPRSRLKSGNGPRELSSEPADRSRSRATAPRGGRQAKSGRPEWSPNR
jgi:hypothetical protein